MNKRYLKKSEFKHKIKICQDTSCALCRRIHRSQKAILKCKKKLREINFSIFA